MDALASATWALALDITSSVLALNCSLIVATSAFSRMFSPLTLSIWSSSASRSDMNSSFSASSAASSWRVCSATASDAFICSIVASIVCSSAPSPKLFSAPEGFMMLSRTGRFRGKLMDGQWATGERQVSGGRWKVRGAPQSTASLFLKLVTFLQQAHDAVLRRVRLCSGRGRKRHLFVRRHRFAATRCATRRRVDGGASPHG
mmetsp:Transcript_104443/g.301096  ORF Transcript_104443/g.301096 Transcript_104443/m.301096 type:complete len:203 (-) Transcript_104443:222-830(-)